MMFLRGTGPHSRESQDWILLSPMKKYMPSGMWYGLVLPRMSLSESLDRYLREQASQDIRRRVSNCFLAVEQETYALAGYYTLAASSIPISDLPEAETRRLPRYPLIPATLIGRLAVDSRYRGRQLGMTLVADAVRRLDKAGVKIVDLIVRRPTLDDVFMTLTGRRAEEPTDEGAST